MGFRRKLIVSIVLPLLAVILAACSVLPPSPQDVQKSFAALSTGASNVTGGSESTTQTGPPTWTYDYTLTQSGGGTIDFALSITSSYDLNSAAFSGESGDFSGTMTFTNFTGNGYVFNGTIDVSGGFTTTSAQNGDVLFDATYNYIGTLTVSGQGVSKMYLNYTAKLTMDLNTNSLTSGPTYTGTVKVNNFYSYDVGNLSSNIKALELEKIIW